MFKLRVRSNFSAAHAVTLPDSSVENVHGHNWQLETVIAAETLDRFGMVADFEALKGMIEEIIVKKLDHTFLNETGFFPKDAATCELVAKWIHDSLSQRIKELRDDLVVESVTLWESPGCSVSYSAK